LDQSLKPSARLSALVGLAELFVAVLIAGVSAINMAMPAGAYARAHDPRFLFLAASNGMLALLGAVWTWGELPVGPPSWTGATLPILALVLIVTLLFLAATVWPRRV
jgi:hypothetical protein